MVVDKTKSGEKYACRADKKIDYFLKLSNDTTSGKEHGDGNTIPDKIFGTKWSNLVKLDRKRKVWYLFLYVFYLLFAKSTFLKGD